MIYVKNVKSLSYDEINNINSLINIYYDYNDLTNNDFIIYEKNINNEIIGFIGMITKKFDNICLINQLCIIDYNQNIINKAKNLTNKMLLICLPFNHEFIDYLKINGFILYEEVNNSVVLIYKK